MANNCCLLEEETLNVQILEETIEFSIAEEPINVSVECWGGVVEGAIATHLELEFEGSDLGSTDRLFIGTAPPNSKVQNTVVEIEDPSFDPSVQMSVGTESAMALLMCLDENVLQREGQYSILNNLEYTGRPDFFLFFTPSIASIGGRGKVTIYFN